MEDVSHLIARFLKERGVDRVFSLCGGHIFPLWDRVHGSGIRIVDVRDERAAVHMAHAHRELTGRPGVVLVTAGPGMTNAITGIANAHVARTPILVISGVPPRPQESMGALQAIPQAEIVRPITRYARTVMGVEHVLRELDEAVSYPPTLTSPPTCCGKRSRRPLSILPGSASGNLPWSCRRPQPFRRRRKCSGRRLDPLSLPDGERAEPEKDCWGSWTPWVAFILIPVKAEA